MTTNDTLGSVEGETRRPVSRFTIIRLVPDPIAGECVNIGVAVISPGGMVYTTFLQDWTRVEAFAGEEHAKDARDFLKHCIALDTAKDIEWFSQEASGIYQYTPLQPSLEPADELLGRLAMRYLKDGAA